MESTNDIIINKDLYPNFYKLYTGGIVFENNYSPRNSCATGNNEFSGMTGLYTIQNNCTANIYKDNTYFVKNWNKYQSIEKLNKIAKLNKVIEESKNEKSFYNSTQEKIRKEENRKETRIDESNFETLD